MIGQHVYFVAAAAKGANNLKNSQWGAANLEKRLGNKHKYFHTAKNFLSYYKDNYSRKLMQPAAAVSIRLN